MNENNYRTKNSIIGSVSGLLIGLGLITSIQNCARQEGYIQDLRKLLPVNAHAQYVNNDTLADLVYNTGKIYLQTNEGSFISIDSAMNQEKARIDSTYKAKLDSIKNSYLK